MAISVAPDDDDAVEMTQAVRQDEEDAEMVDGTQPVRQPRVANRRPRLAAVNDGVDDINLAEGETSVGRAPSNTARLFDSARDGTAQMVSGKHALVVRQGDGHYALSDVGSTHGTTVNGRTVTKQDVVLLREGDMIVFGTGRAVAADSVETYTLFTFTVHDVSPPLEEAYRKRVMLAVERASDALRLAGGDQAVFLGHAGALVRSMHAAEATLKNGHARANQNLQQRQTGARTASTKTGRRERNEETAADCGRGHGGGGDGNRRGRGGGGSGRGGGGSGRGGGGWRGRGGSGRGRGAGLTSTGHIAPNSGIAKTSARGQRRRRQ
jgi:pSer/pThr/pTyr-binding forkhead associated (FHA) protein